MKTELYHWTGSAQLVTGLIASFYVILLQVRKGTSKFFILPTSDNLATIAIGLAFIITSYNLENNQTCLYITLLDVALILTPLINAFMSIVAYVLQNYNVENNSLFPKSVHNYIKYSASLCFQWVIPIVVCLTIYISSNEEKQLYINNNCTSCESISSENETGPCCILSVQNEFKDTEFYFTSPNHSSRIQSIEEEQNKLTNSILEKIYRIVKESIVAENDTINLNSMEPAPILTDRIVYRQNNTTNNSDEEFDLHPGTMDIFTSNKNSEEFTTIRNTLSTSEANYDNDEVTTASGIELTSHLSSTLADLELKNMLSTSPTTVENNQENISDETTENVSDYDIQMFRENNTGLPQNMNFYTKTQNDSFNTSGPFTTIQKECRVCHKADTFTSACFLIILFFCCCIPVALGMTTYMTVNKKIALTPKIHRMQDEEQESQSSQRNIQILKATNKMLYFMLIASIIFWSPQMVNILLNFWLCFHLPFWIKVLLFFASQLFEIVRCIVNVRFLHFLTKYEQNAGLLGKNQSAVSPTQVAEDNNIPFFQKVKDKTFAMEIQGADSEKKPSNSNN